MKRKNKQFDLTIRYIRKTVDLILCQLLLFVYFNTFCFTYIADKCRLEVATRLNYKSGFCWHIKDNVLNYLCRAHLRT